MTLAPKPSDKALLALKEERANMVNGVHLGPNSPLRKKPRTDPGAMGRASALEHGNARAVDAIDPAGRMNSWERQRAQQLEAYKRAGVIVDWRFEGITLRLADRTGYTPDFVIILAAGGQMALEEVKGFWRDDARVKIKVAARQFPWFEFRALRLKGGSWDVEVIRP